MNTAPIAKIYVATHGRDFHLARLCVASIRYWYPDIPIILLSDFLMGEFDSRSLERDFNVIPFDTPICKFGYGYSKLEGLFPKTGERYLMLDADTVLLGPVLDVLNATPGDFVIQPDQSAIKKMDVYAYPPPLLKAFDPAFDIPDYIFNTGQYVGTEGLLAREDFASVLKWDYPRQSLHPEIFKCGEQGLLNYVLFKAEHAGRLVIAKCNIFFYPRFSPPSVTVEQIAQKRSEPGVLHWAGFKSHDIREMERYDILSFYDAYARSRRSWGSRWIDLPQTLHTWKKKLDQKFWLVARCFLGMPYFAGGIVQEIDSTWLHGFYYPENFGEYCWRWTEPKASIDLALPSGAYRIRIEAGAPEPMGQERLSAATFFIDGQEISKDQVQIQDGIIEINFRVGGSNPTPSHNFSWSIEPQEAGKNERPLGLPVTALWVFKRFFG